MVVNGCSLEGMMLTLKLQYFGHLMRRVDSLEKTLMLGGIGGGRRRGWQRDEMAGWHHWLDGRESEWTSGDGDGQGGLACCDSWGRKESDTTERLNWTETCVLLNDQLQNYGEHDYIHDTIIGFDTKTNKQTKECYFSLYKNAFKNLEISLIWRKGWSLVSISKYARLSQ